MRISPPEFHPSSDDHLLLAYVADLELEVDRLRKQGQFLRDAIGESTIHMRRLLQDGAVPEATSTELTGVLDELAGIKQDLADTPGYHPANDQVIAIAVRPLIEQVFRWQQRLSGAPHATLHLELATDSVNWFPARFRHIVDNLISNALKYRDPTKGEVRVTVTLNQLADSFRLRVIDNGLGIPWDKHTAAFELFYRSTPWRNTSPGVGLAVVKLLIEQSGGSLTVESEEGKGSNFIVSLPRYDVGDYLT